MSVDLPIIYNQQDERWRKILLGFNTDSRFTIGDYGCVLSCLAMVSSLYGYRETPLSLNGKLKGLGEDQAFSADSGTYVWGGITRLFHEIHESVVFTPQLLTDMQVNEVKQAVLNHHPVMLQIDADPSTAAPNMHYVLAVDIDPKDENNITIADPLTGKIHSLKDYLRWFKPNVRKTIEKYAIYTGMPVWDMLITKANAFDDIRTLFHIDASLGLIDAKDQLLGHIRSIQGVL